MKDHVKVPMDRVGAVIGKEGETVQELEEKTGAKIDVDSENGRVEIDRSKADPLHGFKVKKVIKAIARGFSPKKAMELLKEENVLDIIKITRYSNNSKTNRRLRGRVIGKEGRCRELIEELTETYVSVKGKTISIIGKPRNVSAAGEAVEKILSGTPHGAVYSELEDWRREETKRKILGEEFPGPNQ